jgi:hypothetical protein
MGPKTMRDFIDFETTPCDEPCTQVGGDDYSRLARLEIKAFHDQIIREFGHAPENSGFKTKSNPHDFGSYLSLQFNFEDEDEVASEYGYGIESNFPSMWDNEARAYLESNGYELNDASHTSNVDYQWVPRLIRKEARKLATYKQSDFEHDINGSEEPFDEDEGEELTYCPNCGGSGDEMGKLGDRVHYRCRQCGTEFSHLSNEETEVEPNLKVGALLDYNVSGDPPNTSTATKDHAYELKQLAKQMASMKGLAFPPNDTEKD